MNPERNIAPRVFRKSIPALSVRVVIFGGLMAIAAAGFAQAPTPQRPPVGGIGSPADAMIFYVARGAAGACGQNCSEWIAAEGTVQWDTHKRLLAILDRQAGRKLPVVIHSWGESRWGRPKPKPAMENPKRNASRSSVRAGRSTRR